MDLELEALTKSNVEIPAMLIPICLEQFRELEASTAIIGEKVQTLLSTLEVLKGERSALNRRKATLKGLLAPIRKLPNELLAVIFRITIQRPAVMGCLFREQALGRKKCTTRASRIKCSPSAHKSNLTRLEDGRDWRRRVTASKEKEGGALSKDGRCPKLSIELEGARKKTRPGLPVPVKGLGRAQRCSEFERTREGDATTVTATRQRPATDQQRIERKHTTAFENQAVSHYNRLLEVRPFHSDARRQDPPYIEKVLVDGKRMKMHDQRKTKDRTLL
ncbi:hypothetical protein BKA70DRAFT_1223821 [Coprinopsis sp. MPI-PUGE-AT-0042]|nr:hypothetical protein BKA70DRAFT_1223821 [Coprinopsis sp. MPI-PUGE-AT-0042]